MSRAARPATCGAAMDVPEIVRVEVDPEIHAEVIPVPGAYMSTQLPKFEYEARLSDWSVAPMVIADGARAGENWHASAPEFPAATTTTSPARVAAATASSTAEFAPPPRLKLMIPGPPGWLATAQLMPATTEDEKPDPAQSRTLTATTVAVFATPYVLPATVPAT